MTSGTGAVVHHHIHTAGDAGSTGSTGSAGASVTTMTSVPFSSTWWSLALITTLSGVVPGTAGVVTTSPVGVNSSSTGSSLPSIGAVTSLTMPSS